MEILGITFCRGHWLPTRLPLRLFWPNPLTSFVGRKQDLARLTSILATTRLITLTGVGGTGKTRLSLQVAAEVAEGSRGAIDRATEIEVLDDAGRGEREELADEPGRLHLLCDQPWVRNVGP